MFKNKIKCKKNYILFAVFFLLLSPAAVFFCILLLRLPCLLLFIFHFSYTYFWSALMKNQRNDSVKIVVVRNGSKKKQKPNRFLLLKHHFKRKDSCNFMRWAMLYCFLCCAAFCWLFRVEKFLILNSVFFCALLLRWRTIFNFCVWYFFDCLLIWFHYRWSVFMKTRERRRRR